jgi:hypothetical protein
MTLNFTPTTWQQGEIIVIALENDPTFNPDPLSSDTTISRCPYNHPVTAELLFDISDQANCYKLNSYLVFDANHKTVTVVFNNLDFADYYWDNPEKSLTYTAMIRFSQTLWSPDTQDVF